MFIQFIALLLSIDASQIRSGVPISHARFSRGRDPIRFPMGPSIRIPVDIFDSGRVSVNGTINDEGQVVSMTLTGQNSAPRVETDYDASDVSLTIRALDSTNITLGSDTFTALHSTSPTGSWLTTGPRSRLVRAFESVGLAKIEHVGLLILGGTRSDFADNFCVLNSSLLVPFGQSQRRIFLYLGEQLVGQYESIKFYDGIINPTAMVMIPSPSATLLEERLRSTGSIRIPPRTFHNCTESSLEGFPDMRLVFQMMTGEIADEIIFTPMDYYKVNEDLRTCTPRYIHTYVPISELVLNPYAMPEINLRITDSSLELCDAF